MGDWFLLGAFARAIVVHGVAGLPRGSETFDVDIAIAVADDDEYRARVSPLENHGGSRIRYRANGLPVDVIAYGGIAPDNELMDDTTTLDVTGMAEARSCTFSVLVADGLRIDCASLHAQMLLKLVAWQARGAATTKDARDIGSLIDACHHGTYGDQVWQDETALEACDYVHDLAGAFRAGALIKRDFTSTSIQRALGALDDDGLSQLADEIGGSREQRETITERLDALRRGIRSN